MLAYVGTYSSPQGPEGSKGNGQGIYLFEMNPATGALKQRELFADGSNPSWLAFDRSKTHLYAANEISNYEGKAAGSVSAWAIERGSGRLKRLNTVSSEGAGPCHCSVHPSGKHVLVANYHGGTIAVLPVRAGGELGPATDVKRDVGSVGPLRAASAPAGSFAISGHDRTHAHMIQADASGRFVMSADLGQDRILIWKYDGEKGTLTPNDPAFVTFPAGDGPRHFVFHPNGRWFYSLQEEASTVVMFEYDSSRGVLTAKQTVSSLPKEFRGTNFTSEVMISGDGKFLYAANRLHDSIAWFSIGASGEVDAGGRRVDAGGLSTVFRL